MPIEDLMNLPESVDLAADVCLVGSGPAAWTLAKELSNSHIRVLVLESGGGRLAEDTERLNETEDVGMPLFNGRCRMLGGTTEMPGWANRCIAFDAIDYENRPWVPQSGWPFGPEAIDPYLPKAAAYLGATRLRSATSIPPAPRGVDAPELDAQLLSHVYWAFGRDRFGAPTRFRGLFRAQASERVRVVLHATVTDLKIDSGTGQIRAVEVTDAVGRKRLVPSKLVVLCAGGIENARLLLNANTQAVEGLANRYDLVGRFLMDHPRDVNMAVTFDPREADRIRRALGPFRLVSDGEAHMYAGGFALSEALQRKEGLLNCAAWPMEEMSADDPLGAAFRLLKRDRSQLSADWRRICAEPRGVVRSVHSRVVLDQPDRPLLSKIGLIIASEQRPDPSSRVTLSDRRDRFGIPIARTNWCVSPDDLASQRRLAKLIASEFRRLGLPEARLPPWIEDESSSDVVLKDGCHPTGTTRMATGPGSGVVDPNCEVFGVAGLFVAGSSVFPTASHANPTLMIVAMACRLAEHLKLRILTARETTVVGKRAEPSVVTKADVPSSEWIPTLPTGTRVAVTGANGFIGGRLVKRLMAEGAVVTCLNRGMANESLKSTGSTIRLLDFSNPGESTAALEGIQVVFHCAYDWKTEGWNRDALRSLITAAKQNHCERFVHVSSYVVYEIPSSGEVTEATEETTAESGYARTKREMELELLALHRADGFPCTILQPTVVYGPYSESWTLRPAEALRFGTVVLPDEGKGLCPAVHIDDVVDALLIAATNPNAVGERFLISGPEPVRWSEFYEKLAQAAGVAGPHYLPLKVIECENGKLRQLRRLLLTPERLVRRIGQVGSVKRVVDKALRLFPTPLRRGLADRLYGPESRRRGYIHMPSIGHALWMSGQSTITSRKARRQLGYVPRIGVEQGMESVRSYLREVLGR